MSYVFLLILLFPVKLIRKLFRKDTGKNLVIQTAKIGDFVKEGANKRGNSSRLTQSFHFFMFEPIF
ncbi:hypothetical protein M8N49_19180, partial [Enterobacter kobei]|nr:hypothetical protein [Enterobacter kobei]